jgi:hypothetical protein
LYVHQISTVFRDIPVPIGAGRQQVALLDLIPTTCMASVIQVLEDFRDKL